MSFRPYKPIVRDLVRIEAADLQDGICAKLLGSSMRHVYVDTVSDCKRYASIRFSHRHGAPRRLVKASELFWFRGAQIMKQGKPTGARG